MNADMPKESVSMRNVSGWRHLDLLMVFAIFCAVFFTPIGRDTKTLLLALAVGLGLSRTIASHAAPLIGRRWCNGRDRMAYLGAYLLSFPVTCLVGYLTVMIARRSAE